MASRIEADGMMCGSHRGGKNTMILIYAPCDPRRVNTQYSATNSLLVLWKTRSNERRVARWPGCTVTAYRAELRIGFTFSSLAQLRVPPSPPSSTVVRSEPIGRCIHNGEWKRRVSQTPQGLLSKSLFCICTDGSRATERRFQYGTSSLPVEAACLRHLLPSSDHRARRNSLSLDGYTTGCALYFVRSRSIGIFTVPRSRNSKHRCSGTAFSGTIFSWNSVPVPEKKL